MLQLVVALFPLTFGLFWAWMFRDMRNNRTLPPCFVTVSNGRDPQRDWTLAFIGLNIVTAMVYYVTVYSQRR